MAKLVYIIAAGHSGSTLLDLLVGSLPDVFSTGEVTHLPWQLNRTKQQRESVDCQNVCTCLKPFRDCSTWSTVFNSLNEKTGFSIQEEPYRFRMSFNPSQTFRHQNYLASKLLRVAGLVGKEYPALSFIDLFAAPLFNKIVRNNWMLFDIICESQKVEYVVDSSKDNLRMALLAAHRPEDTFVIVLKRNVYGFAYSQIKRGGNINDFLPNWINLYKKTDTILKNIQNVKCLNVAYEELCRDPVSTRQKISIFLGLNSKETKLAIDTTEYHLIAGNPMRYKGNITIRYDNRWENALTKEQRRIIDSKINDF